MNLYIRTIRSAIKAYPIVIPHLTGRARWVAFAAGGEYKTYDYYLQQLTRLITSVYNGNLGGEFIDIMANLIQGQIYQAVNQAWLDSGMDGSCQIILCLLRTTSYSDSMSMLTSYTATL